MNFGNKNVNFEKMILERMERVKSVTSRGNNVSQEYEEIDYSVSDSSQVDSYIKDGILYYTCMGEECTKEELLLNDTISNDTNTRDLLRRLKNNNASTRASLKSYAVYYELYLDGKVSLSDDYASRLKKFYDLYQEYKVEEQTYEVDVEDNDVKRITLSELTNIKSALEEALKNTNSDEEKQMIQYYIIQYQKSINLYEYDSLTYTDDYKKFVSDYNYKNLGYDFDNLLLCNWDPVSYYNEYVKGPKTKEAYLDWYNHYDIMAIAEMLIDMPQGKGKNPVDILSLFPKADFDGNIELYPFMTKEQIDMYHYLCATEGYDSANKYLDVIRQDVNFVAATYYADKFLQTLDLNDNNKIEKSLDNYFNVSGKGLLDGVSGFYDGISFLSDNDSAMTIRDYEKMIVVQYLQQNSNYYDDIYQFNSSFGNMIPAMVTSAAITLLATPAGGTSILGASLNPGTIGSLSASALMGLSAGGNAKHQGLVQGNSLLSSSLYGMFVGASESTLGFFLGKIPGISKVAGLTFGNLLSEGVEEYLQEWVDAGLQAAILGEDIDWSQIPENAKKSFIMGTLMSGFTNGGQSVINLTINGITKEINVEDTIDYISKNPNKPIESIPVISEIIEQSNGEHNDNILDLTQYYNGDKISASPGIDMTARIIPVGELNKLLTDDSVVSKFTDFDNNLNLFSVNSKQSYIYAMMEYFNVLKTNGCPISDDMQKRYDTIIAQSTAIKDLNKIIPNGEFYYSMQDRIEHTSVNYLNMILFSDKQYNTFIEDLARYPYLLKYINLKPFHHLYEHIKTNNIDFDLNAWNKLENLNQLYFDMTNGNRNTLNDYSEYGSNQNSVRRLALNPRLNKKLYSELENIVKGYYPTMNKSEINKLLKGMNVNGVCSYATVVNELVVQYDGREEQFKNTFGYDLYRMENGQKVINSEFILTDLYCFANSNNSEVIQLIKKGKKYVYSTKDDKRQIGMSYQDGKNAFTLNNWLNWKKTGLIWNTKDIFIGKLLPNSFVQDTAVNLIREKVLIALALKHTVEIDVFSVQGAPYPYTLYSTDKSKYSDYVMDDRDSNGNQHAVGHSMFVTGIDENGDLIVSSWGSEYILKFDEIRHRNISLFESYLS